MKTNTAALDYKGFRFPPEIISHAVWLYFRFSLSFRAVDQDGTVLDILVQRRRNKHAAKRFFRKLLKGVHYVPRVIITDKLKSYGTAKREILPGVEHRQHKGLNNRAENSPQPTRLREKKMRRFKSAKHAQRFLSADRASSLAISNHEGTVCVQGNTVPFYRPDSRPGMRSSKQKRRQSTALSTPLLNADRSNTGAMRIERHTTGAG